MTRISILLLLLAAALALAFEPGARACGNAVEIDTKEAARLIREAERAIERGEYQKAIDSFGEVEVAGTGLFSLGASDRMKRRGEALQRRIDLLVSIARVRLAREQIWLAVTYLQSLDRDLPDTEGSR